MWCWHKDRYVDQCSRRETLEKTLTFMPNWFQQESQDNSMGGKKTAFFSNYQYSIIYSKDIRKKQEETVNNFVSKSLNFHEINKLLEKYNLPKWTEEIEYQYCPI